MLVVSDTSPLNYLVLIRHAEVLLTLFGKVYTTPEVLKEMSHPAAPAETREWAASPPTWLQVRKPSALVAMAQLGRGETEAISLAREMNADVVLIDERKGAEVASSLGLFVTGTLGVLQLADEKSALKLSDAISALKQTSFRATEDVFETVLRLSKERRQTP